MPIDMFALSLTASMEQVRHCVLEPEMGLSRDLSMDLWMQAEAYRFLESLGETGRVIRTQLANLDELAED